MTTSPAAPAPLSASDLAASLDALLAGERDRVANLANASALLADALDDVNWIGFYLYDGTELVVGPFQGQPACVRIPIGSGVCGTAAAERRTLVVPDVHAFEGHIACDARSRSEVVIPMVHDGELLGVLDVDSPSLDRFTDADVAALEAAVAVLVRQLTA